MPLFGQNKAVRRSLEKRVTDRLLKRAKTPANGRMACLQRPRGTAEGPGSRNGEKYPDVAPFHRRDSHKTERREFIYVSSRTNLNT